LKSIQNSAKQIAAAIKATDSLVKEQSGTMNELKENLISVIAEYTKLVDMVKSTME
jgi:septum formation topological specificity factor MinE